MAKRTIDGIEHRTKEYRELLLVELVDELLREIKGLRRDLKKIRNKDENS